MQNTASHTLDDFFRFARQHLAAVGLMNKRGGLLYSGLHTLAPGAYYLLGFNPGGAEHDPSAPTIEQDIETLRANMRRNAYVEECWGPHKKPGDAPFQRRVQTLAQLLGVQLQDICASNLIFCKSSRSSDVPYPQYADKCWPVHERILEIVSPQCIVTIGNSERWSAYSYLKALLLKTDKNETMLVQIASSGHGRYSLKAFKARYNGRSFMVIGLPHLSYYSLTASGSREKVRIFITDITNQL